MPKVNTAYDFDISLVSQADTKLFQVNPTLATGDFKIAKDEGAYTNLTNLPVVSPAGSRNVKVSLTATEMNASRIAFQAVDASGAEWCDLAFVIESSPDDLTVANIKLAILADNTAFNGASIALVKAKTDSLPASPAATADIASALEATIADSIPSDGNRPSVKQALYMLTQFMLERRVNSTTVSVKKPDGTTDLFTLTLDSALAPTTITRAT